MRYLTKDFKNRSDIHCPSRDAFLLPLRLLVYGIYEQRNITLSLKCTEYNYFFIENMESDAIKQ